MLPDIAGLHQGIPLERIGCLGYILVTPYVVERQHLEPVSDYAPQLRKLMFVVGGKYYFLHNIL